MSGRTYKEVKSENPLIRWVQKRLYKENKNWLAVMTGETGSGKSWSSLKLASEIDPDFNVKKVPMSPIEFLESLEKGDWGQGDCIVWDEAGVSLSSKEYMTIVNRAIEDILETFRRKNIAVIFTVPSQNNLDKDVRRLLHSYLQTKTINYASKRVNVKWLRMDYNPKQDKIYYHYHKKKGRDSKLPKKIKNVWVGKPRQELIEAYEEKRDSYQEELHKKNLEKIKNKISKSKEDRGPTKKDKIKEKLEEEPDKKYKEIAQEMDSSVQYVKNIASSMDISK